MGDALTQDITLEVGTTSESVNSLQSLPVPTTLANVAPSFPSCSLGAGRARALYQASASPVWEIRLHFPATAPALQRQLPPTANSLNSNAIEEIRANVEVRRME